MNGAIALPLASTMRPPNTAIITSTGMSQYFFRARTNAQSSPANSVTIASKLVDHRVAGRAGWLSLNPVRWDVGLETQPQRILPARPQQESKRGDRREEYQPESHRTDAPVQEQPDPQPHGIQRREHAGRHE